jgi:hypothetical protein
VHIVLGGTAASFGLLLTGDAAIFSSRSRQSSNVVPTIMSWFQLDPASLAERTRGSGAPIPSFMRSLGRGTVGFTLLSVAGFAPWVLAGRWFARKFGEVGLYAGCALVFIGLSGPLLHRLILGAGSLARFYKVFTLAFMTYAVAWIVGWMSLRGHLGSIVGLLAGTAAMGSILALAFDAGTAWLKIVVVLFLGNAAGYFLGGWLEARVPGAAGKLLWGVCYGAGFGAGLGYAFHSCQSAARNLLAAASEDGVPLPK